MKNKTVLLFGTFDGVHPGHLNFFQQAKLLGETLIAVVALDATVEKVKGRPPKHDQDSRLFEVSAVSDVNKAMLGYPGDKYKVIEEIQPDIIALGYDQTVFIHGLETALTERGLSPKIVRLKPYHPEKFKSSIINARN